MNTRKLAVSVLMLVGCLLSACAPAVSAGLRRRKRGPLALAATAVPPDCRCCPNFCAKPRYHQKSSNPNECHLRSRLASSGSVPSDFSLAY